MVSGVSVSSLELIPLIDIAADGRRGLRTESESGARRDPRLVSEDQEKSKGGKERAEIAQQKSKKAGKRIHLEVCNGYLNNLVVNSKTLPQVPLRT
jgi:hypothetical protein